MTTHTAIHEKAENAAAQEMNKLAVLTAAAFSAYPLRTSRPSFRAKRRIPNHNAKPVIPEGGIPNHNAKHYRHSDFPIHFFFKHTEVTVRLTHYICEKKLMVIAVLHLMFINACVRHLLRRMAEQILVIKSFFLQGSFPLGNVPYYSYLLLTMSYLTTKIYYYVKINSI